jgi:hypothetical protein
VALSAVFQAKWAVTPWRFATRVAEPDNFIESSRKDRKTRFLGNQVSQIGDRAVLIVNG